MIHGMIALAATLAVTGAYSHPATDNAVVYFTIQNSGAADTLDGVHCSAAWSAGLHQSKPASGSTNSMRGVTMVPVTSLPVPPHGSLTFQPGGYHVMLERLKHPLAAGEHFTVALHFAHAGWIDATVTVRPY